MVFILKCNSYFYSWQPGGVFFLDACDEAQLQQQQQEELSDSGLILNEIQASVSEAATVIESEIKGN